MKTEIKCAEWQNEGILPCMFLRTSPCSPYDRARPRDSVSTLGSMTAPPARAGRPAPPLGGTQADRPHAELVLSSVRNQKKTAGGSAGSLLRPSGSLSLFLSLSLSPAPVLRSPDHVSERKKKTAGADLNASLEQAAACVLRARAPGSL